jgi:cytochrome P450
MVQVQPNLPPGPVPLPAVGNILQFRRDPLAFVRGVARSYGDIAAFHMSRVPVILLSRPEYVRYVLVDHARTFSNREFMRNLRQTLGDGLLTTDGEFHRQQRRLVQPAFHKKRVEGYAGIMVHHTEELLESWQPGQRIDIARAMQTLTMRIVAKALFDVDLRHEAPELGQAFTDVIENPVGLAFSLRGLPVDLPFTPYHMHMEGRRLLDEYVFGLIARRRDEGRDVGDIVSMLLHAQADNTSMSDQQIRDQTMTLLAAGHETTANALTWTFYLLSEHPGVREKLVTEVADVLEGRAPTVEDLPSLTYLDWVVTESMRVYPPAWTQGRYAQEEFELGGYTFPRGTGVMVSQWVMHHQPEIWGDPETFRPERWGPANGPQPPQGAYFPFGMGPRMCIGMPFAQLEARLLLATILQRFSPELVPGWPVVPRPRVTLRPKYGIQMTLQPTRLPVVARR